MSVVLLTSDLAVVARVEGAARRLGKKLLVFGNESPAAESSGADPVDLLIIDLSTHSLDIRTTVARLKSGDSSSTRVIAFGPHVHEQRLAAARDAGCDVVVSRGQFFAQLDTILTG